MKYSYDVGYMVEINALYAISLFKVCLLCYSIFYVMYSKLVEWNPHPVYFLVHSTLF